ncbi:hypothetical protein, partial [Aeromonas hydrophila]|uniref:hypothetical protein n=1 Tax=Aeromonas hydrophila TaxID=644 RepID=UPI000575859D
GALFVGCETANSFPHIGSALFQIETPTTLLLFQIRTKLPVIFILISVVRLAPSTICLPVWWQAKE